MEYPYYKNYTTKKEILEDFKTLQKYKVRKTHLLKLSSMFSIQETYSMLNRITDYFSEECKVKCSFQHHPPPIEQFQKIKHKIKGVFDYQKIDKIIYKNIKGCTNFNITIVISVLQFFKPERYLDFSSGWGDRLIGAMAYGCEYTGVDPSECMQPKYKEMIQFFKPKDKDRYVVHKKGFENFKVKKDYYDLVFTSPPFFDLEIYENASTQSINKFNTLSKWKKNFLFPAIKKSHASLKEGGHLALYISDYFKNGKNFTYVRDVRKMCKKLNFEYLGTFNWVNVDSSRKVRDIYIWKKV
tara:strand:- start:172 stop:1065 length:894 start_codon:yes stop_codon:yes gene_type:complete